MSKKRSISKKINLLDFPLPESSKRLPNSEIYSNDLCIQDIFFGEKIKSESGCTSKKTDSSDICTSDYELQDVLSYKSSCSSTSGSDDIEIEATKKISSEFTKLDNILYGEVEISSKEINEYNQWREHFPHLRIIGSAMTLHPSNIESTEEYYEEIIAEHSDADYNCIFEEKNPNTKTKIKETVINNVLKQVKSQLLNKSHESYQILSIPDVPISTQRRERETSENNSLRKESNNNELVKESETTAPLHNSSFLQSNFEYQSPIMRSHLSASKWQKDDSSSDFSSLPHIPQSYVPYSNTGSKKPSSANKSDRNLHHYSANSRKKSDTSVAKKHSKYTYSPRVENIVLPPIQNLCLEDERSISSTPQKFNIRPVSNKFYKYSEEKSKSYMNYLEKN